ncbi:MAG TPA: 1,4-dihydroxy-6-naphthoate synthase [Thermodesulfovibrionales bacterium]|nr:1,4-dihydroxy-6-naphthoate synthase [Thermodesulfovibrionales bacterium]
MRTLSLGYSPCPNDTFIFYPLVHGKIDTGELRFKEILLDVETLNKMALRSEFDITKISYHAFGYLREDYCLLRSGSALGRSCGPLLVSKEDYSLKDLNGKRIAIPGRLTTANLLLQLFTFDSKIPFSSSVEMPFHKIMDAVANGDVDAGLIIHEGRFTYPLYGLKKIVDLGEWWENKTGFPLPLGGILAKRDLGEDLIKRVDSFIRNSIEYSLNHKEEPKVYIKQHSQELKERVIEQHINLYVNDFSLDIGKEGLSAVQELFRRAETRGIIKGSRNNILCVT